MVRSDVLIAGFTIVVVVGLLSSGTAAVAGQGTQQADATEVDSCTVIDEPGRYVLADDIEDAGSETCIEIQSSDVVFDGNGYAVDGVQNESGMQAFQAEVEVNGTFPWQEEWARVGIAVTGEDAPSNVTVRNVEVSEWFFGVYAGNDTAQVSVGNVTSVDNGDGISFYESEDVSLTNTSSRDYSAGVVFDNVTAGTVQGSTFQGAVDGVFVASSSDVTIADNVMVDNEDGAFLVDVSGLEVRDNQMIGSYWTGAAVLFANGSEFANNTVAETRGNVTFLHDTADLVLHQTSDTSFENTTVRDSEANWTVYAANTSLDNAASNLTVGGDRLSTVFSDVAFVAGDRAAETPEIDGDVPVLSTSVGNQSSFRVDWHVEADAGATNATSDEPSTP